jgi:glutamyl/glutaminyl-tRNA synthetase
MLTRLAPTPSGFLHRGNIYNFLLNWLWARACGGKVLLRIDDADSDRKRPGYVEDIFSVLHWLGLDWDIGPAGVDDFEKHWSQAYRTELYTTMLTELEVKQILFACTCSRSKTAAGHTCNCINTQQSLHKPGVAWRIRVEAGAQVSFTDSELGAVNINLSQTCGSFIVKRKDGIAAYQVASLADDRHFGVTHICRGADLLHSTAMQLYIDGNLSSPYISNSHFWHHRLLKDVSENKLSKSTGLQNQSIIHTMQKEILVQDFAVWMGWEVCTGLEQLTEQMRQWLRLQD